MCRTRAASTHPRNAELAVLLQSLQHVESGLLSTLKNNGAATFEESFPSCYSAAASQKKAWLNQVGQVHPKHLAAPQRPPVPCSCPLGRATFQKMEGWEEGWGKAIGWPEHDRARDPGITPAPNLLSAIP